MILIAFMISKVFNQLKREIYKIKLKYYCKKLNETVDNLEQLTGHRLQILY